ncbi:MAG: hypothetical protein ACYC21_13995 [Eubacteriales bacterium]
MKRLFLTLLVLMAITIGCIGREENSIIKTVKEYNNKLIIALKTNPDILKEVAVERERGRVEIYMAQMADEHKIIDSQLEQLNIKSVKILTDPEWADWIDQYKQGHQRDLRVPDEGSLTEYKSGHAMVKTEEVWTYRYLDTGTRKEIEKPKLLGYNVTYIVVKDNNKWKVADVMLEEKTLNRDGR